MIGCIQQHSHQIRITQEMFLLKIIYFCSPHILLHHTHCQRCLRIPSNWILIYTSKAIIEEEKTCFERFVKCTLYSVCGCAFPTEVAKATADGSRRYVTWKFILITLDCFCVCKFDHSDFLLIFCVCNLPSRLISIYLAGRLGSL